MTRLRVALAFLIIVALQPAAGVLIDVATNPGLFRLRDDPISRFERHLAPLRAALSGEHVVGYLPPTQAVDRVAHLYSVRYALAPLKVLDQTDLPLVVADGVADPRRLPPELRVHRDFGDSLLLLEPVR